MVESLTGQRNDDAISEGTRLHGSVTSLFRETSTGGVTHTMETHVKEINIMNNPEWGRRLG